MRVGSSQCKENPQHPELWQEMEADVEADKKFLEKMFNSGPSPFGGSRVLVTPFFLYF